MVVLMHIVSTFGKRVGVKHARLQVSSCYIHCLFEAVWHEVKGKEMGVPYFTMNR